VAVLSVFWQKNGLGTLGVKRNPKITLGQREYFISTKNKLNPYLFSNHTIFTPNFRIRMLVYKVFIYLFIYYFLISTILMFYMVWASSPVYVEFDERAHECSLFVPSFNQWAYVRNTWILAARCPRHPFVTYSELLAHGDWCVRLWAKLSYEEHRYECGRAISSSQCGWVVSLSVFGLYVVLLWRWRILSLTVPSPLWQRQKSCRFLNDPANNWTPKVSVQFLLHWVIMPTSLRTREKQPWTDPQTNNHFDSLWTHKSKN